MLVPSLRLKRKMRVPPPPPPPGHESRGLIFSHDMKICYTQSKIKAFFCYLFSFISNHICMSLCFLVTLKYMVKCKKEMSIKITKKKYVFYHSLLVGNLHVA